MNQKDVKKKEVKFRIPMPLYNRLKVASETEGRTMNTVINHLIEVSLPVGDSRATTPKVDRQASLIYRKKEFVPMNAEYDEQYQRFMPTINHLRENEWDDFMQKEIDIYGHAMCCELWKEKFGKNKIPEIFARHKPLTEEEIVAKIDRKEKELDEQRNQT